MNASQFYPVPTKHGDIAVWDTGGTGETVFFVHGNSANYLAWQKQFSDLELTKNCRFVAIDLPGHGKSSKPNDPVKTYTYQGLAEVIDEVMTRMSISDPICVGWSLGANALCALSKIRKIAGLLITGASPIPMNAEGQMDMLQAFNPNPKMFKLLIQEEPFTPEQTKEFISMGGFDPEKAPFMLEAVLKTDVQARYLIAKSRAEKRGCVDCKEVAETADFLFGVAEGVEDKGIKLDFVQNIKYKNPFEQVHVIPNAGHAAFYDRPDVFNPILARFIAAAAKNRST